MEYTIKYSYDGFYRNGHIARIYDDKDACMAHGMGYSYKEARRKALKDLKAILNKPESEKIKI